MIRRLPRLLCLLGLACGASAAAHLEDVVIRFSGRAEAEFRFRPDPAGFPLFFQKLDSAGPSVLISFLETGTDLALGRRDLPPGSPVAWIDVKRLRSPSGKVFLGVELGLRKAPAPAALKAKTSLALTLDLGQGVKGKLQEWSASAPSAPPAPRAEKPASPAESPAPAVPAATVAQVPEPTTPPPPPPAKAAPARVEPEPASAVPDTAILGLLEMRLSGTAQAEEWTLAFRGKKAPEYKLESAVGGAAAVGLTLRRVAFDPPEGRQDFTGMGWMRGLRWRKSGSDLAVVLLLDSALKPEAAAAGSRLTIAFPRRPGFPDYAWSTREPEKLPRPKPDPVRSAHAEGKALEAQGSASLTRRRVFNPAGAGQGMVAKDEAPLLAAPQSKAAEIRRLLAGETVRRVGSQGGYARVVVDGVDTGYVQASAVAYADELTPAQLKAIDAKVQARLAAAAAPPPPPPSLPPAEPVPAPAATAAPAAAPAAPAVPAPITPPAVVKSAPRPAAGSAPTLNMPSASDEARRAVPPEALKAERRAVDSERVDLAPPPERMAYNSFGRRDPFVAVDPSRMDNGIDIDQMKVVGIVWEVGEPLAVLEHVKEPNLSFTVRQGDPVHNGRVARILRESVTFELTEFGISRSFTLRLVSTQERAGR